jgi:hypothetical protein
MCEGNFLVATKQGRKETGGINFSNILLDLIYPNFIISAVIIIKTTHEVSFTLLSYLFIFLNFYLLVDCLGQGSGSVAQYGPKLKVLLPQPPEVLESQSWLLYPTFFIFLIW